MLQFRFDSGSGASTNEAIFQYGPRLNVEEDGRSFNYKRVLARLPLGRQQIGKFGIGKFASYVLANRLSSKKGGKYYSTSMDFKVVDDRGEEEIKPRTPVRIALRLLTEREAKESLKPWTETVAF